MITFLPLGGANDIGASCYYLNVEGTGLVLDCGTHPRKFGIDSLPRFELLKDQQVDVALISHAHQDHIDSLPYLVQHHPYIRIVTTPQTRAVAEVTLHNSVNILQEQLKDEMTIRAYSHDEIDLLIQSIEWQEYLKRFTVNGYRHASTEPVSASFHDAGHIMGSAGILVEHHGRSIFYTGDINLDVQSLLAGAILPNQKIDVVILECTHGSTDSSQLPSRKIEKFRFANAANGILSRGGSILIPVFALGKMQEILAMIWKLMEQGSIPNVDIFSGGVGKKLCGIYDKNRYTVSYNDTDVILTDIPQKDLYEVEHIDDLLRHQCIVLAGSGMMVPNTLSFKLAQRWLSNPKAGIFTVGYMDPGTPGFRISQSNKGDLLQLTDAHEPQNVSCDIDRFRFSAHSNRDGILSVIERLRPSTVVLVHGEHDSIDWMGYSIISQFPGIKVHAAEIGKQITLFE
ncbi:MAG: MBL fold metallo-hydrolase [Bacteriovoracaceae bacterium]|nr:MBL fold metallo-hydrolase [Bacteroidota bacterium]